jgi:hypothetical protein
VRLRIDALVGFEHLVGFLVALVFEQGHARDGLGLLRPEIQIGLWSDRL